MKITSIRNTQVNLVIIWYIIGYHSGKVLYIGLRNTFCIICARAIYNETKPDHICFKNWFRSANAMEADIIVERFRQSLSLYGVRYMRVIGDGDNNVIEKLRNMRPYGIDFVIEKIECANHICRNFNKSLNYTVHDVKWIPCSAKFVSIGGKSNGAGVIETFSISGDGIEKLGEFGKKDHFKCGTFNASSLRDRHLATGDFSGRLKVWDLEDNLVPVYKAEKHKGVINAIDGVAGASNGCGAPEIVTGSKDGSVMVWDVRQKDTPVAKFCPNEGLQGRDCWAVAFGNSYNNEERVVAAGYDNGDIKMYDLKNMSIRWSKCVKNGVVSLQFDRKDIEMNKLVATTLESKIFCFDVRTQHPKKGFAQVVEKAHNSTIWTVKHLPQNREIFMTTGGTGSLCLWKYNYPEKRVDKDSDGLNYGIPGELTLIQNSTLSDQPITSFDWCPDKTGLSVCSAFDQTVRVLITTKLNLY